jgi:hypothetical protein
VHGDRGGGGLLQRFVGEQPTVGAGEFGGRLPAQQGGLDQCGRADAVAGTDRGDIGDPVGQW